MDITHIGLVFLGLAAAIFHKVAGRATVSFWRKMGLNYSERIMQMFFLLWGVGAIIFVILEAIGLIRPQGQPPMRP